jgi:hypothetical protein
MFKFLRKYNKWILAVGGTLLLIVFLIPQSIQGLSQLSSRRGATIATVGADSRKVTQGEFDLARRELQLLANLQNQTLLALEANNDPGHWYLLSREAELAGYNLGPSQGAAILDSLATTPEESMAVMRRWAGGAPREFIYQTLAKLEAVSRLIRLHTTAPRYSDRRLRNAAAERMIAVGADVVVINAANNEVFRNRQEFTTAQLEEQLAAFAEMEPGEGEHGFGYKLPDRFKVEWISVPRELVREAVAGNEDLVNGVSIFKHFRQNPTQFTGTGLDPTQPTPEFDDVKEDVRESLIDTLTNERIDQIERFGMLQLQMSERSLTRSGPYYDLPDDWADKRLDLRNLADLIRDEFGLEAAPGYESRGDRWYAADDAAEFGDIGSASTDAYGNPRRRLADLVQAAREFGGDESIIVQQDIAGAPLRNGGVITPTDALHFWRLRATDPARAPESIDEVRDQLVTDLRALENFQTLEAQLDELRREAIDQGLRKVARRFDTTVDIAPVLRHFDPNLFQQFGVRIPTSIPGLGNSEDALDRILEKVGQLPPLVPVEELTSEQRIIAVAVPERLAVVLVRVVDVVPTTLETYQSLARAGVLGTIMVDDEDNLLGSLDDFSFEALAARHNFEYTIEIADPNAPAEDAVADADTSTEG